tara:strand:- start:984 stop:1292 length:309 start_codon:yes stop_codon:yes gene_type:complete
MTVFIIQKVPRRDFSSADKYGDLKSIVPYHEQIALSPGPVVFQANKILKNFSDDDYLLLVGDPSIIGACCALASRHNNGRYKVLKWDRLDSRYYPIEFNIVI